MVNPQGGATEVVEAKSFLEREQDMIPAAAQIFDKLSRPVTSNGTAAALASMRAGGIAKLDADRVMFPDIRRAVRLLRSGQLLRDARAACRLPPAEGGAC